MAAEESLLLLLQLFESNWFKHQIFKKTTTPPLEILEKPQQVVEIDDLPKLDRISTLHVRSFSDQISSSQESLSSGGSDNYQSPNSVLRSPEKLQATLSGKEAGRLFPEPAVKKEDKEKKGSRSSDGMIRKRNKSKGLSRTKSLSELEFEELKGFMDLGFVFSEEDKNSRLVEIIPGLQRFGRNEDEEMKNNKNDIKLDSSSSSSKSRRPYLSQAWEIMEETKAAENLMWRINAAIGNEMDMKHQLKFWAHSVASAIR